MPQSLMTSLQKQWPTIPIILDEESLLQCVRDFTHMHITNLDESHTGLLENVFLYEKSEEKKHMSIADIRRFLEDISVQPYSPKALYILRDFDEATPEAMNACLKVFEEPPDYAIILMSVKNPESILETIHSRTLLQFRWRDTSTLTPELISMINGYFSGNPWGFITYLYKAKYDLSLALEILRESMQYADAKLLGSMEESLIHLFQVNENPRNILDRVFICLRER